VGFLLVLEEIEGFYRDIEGRLKSLEAILKVSIGILEILEERLKVAICQSLEGRLKATIVIFNHHSRAKEVGS